MRVCIVHFHERCPSMSICIVLYTFLYTAAHQCVYVLYINANSIQAMGSTNDETTANTHGIKNLDFSAKDLEEFRYIRENDPFR